MADAIGQLDCERFLRRLRLVVVEGFFVCCIVGSAFVGGFGNHERVACGVDRRIPVAGCDAGGIGFGRVIGEACSR